MGCGGSKNNSSSTVSVPSSTTTPSHSSPVSLPPPSSSSEPQKSQSKPIVEQEPQQQQQQHLDANSVNALTTKRTHENASTLSEIDSSNQENVHMNTLPTRVEPILTNKDNFLQDNPIEVIAQIEDSPRDCLETSASQNNEYIPNSELEEETKISDTELEVADIVLPFVEKTSTESSVGEYQVNSDLPIIRIPEEIETFPNSENPSEPSPQTLSQSLIEDVSRNITTNSTETSIALVLEEEQDPSNSQSQIGAQSIIIQRHWRGCVVRHQFWKIKQKMIATIRLQRFWRKYIKLMQAKTLAELQFTKALSIQQTFRAYQSRLKLRILRETAQRNQKRFTAASRTQKIWRGYHQRKIFHAMVEEKKLRQRNEAAIRIQSRCRIFISRRKLQERKFQAKVYREKKAALCLQQIYRRYRSKCRLALLRQELFQKKVYTTIFIQRLWRGHVARKLLQRLVKERNHRIYSSILIQCRWRCHVSTRKLKLLQAIDTKRKQSTILLQSIARVIIARRVVKQLRQIKASTRIQMAFRCHQSRVQLLILRQEAFRKRVQASILTQRIWRGYHDRQIFRVLLNNKRQRELENLSSLILQCAWRCHFSRSFLKKLQQLDAQRKNSASIKIQNRIRIKLARKLLRNLQIAAFEALQNANATRIQKYWRRFLQRHTLSILREEYLLAQAILREQQQQELERAMATAIQKSYRGWKARCAVTHQRYVNWAAPIIIRIIRRTPYVMRSYHPHVLVLTLKNATGINTNGRALPNPYAIVGSFNDASSLKSSGGFLGKNFKTKTMFSYARTKSISSTISPQWREQDGATLLISPASWNSRIVLTLMHSATFSKDTFLGQVALDVRQFPQLYTGELVEINNLPLTSYNYPIVDPESREDLALRNCPNGKGTITFSLRLPLLASSMCGWIWRASTYSLTKGQFKRRWMILIDYTLSFYKDPFSLNECKGSIHCVDVLDIVDNDDEGPVVEVYYGQSGKVAGQSGGGNGEKENCWILRWDRLSPPYTRVMWKQKLLKNCKHLRQK